MAEQPDIITTWARVIALIAVPVAGLGVFVYAGLGGPVPLPLYPLVAAAIGLPGWRWLDKIRTNGK